MPVEVPGYHVFHVTRRAPAADVYLAYHRATQAFRDLIVVGRVPDAEYAALRRSVEADVAAAAAVRHPGLAPVEEVGLTADGRLFVAAARPVGRTLREVLAVEGAVRPNRRAVDLGLTLADALAAAHERGVTHGWLGPDSIVLVETRGDAERLVVLGLGTVIAQGAVLAPGAVPPDEAPFVSPERADGGPPSPRGDVFSLGGVILSMLTGGPPPAVRAAGAAETHLAANAVARVLRQARAADPGRRYSSARDLGTALRAVRDPEAEASPAALPLAFSPPAAVPAAAGGGRRRLAVAAAGVIVLAAVAGTTFTRRGRADVAPLASGALRAPEQGALTQQVPIPPVPISPVPTPPVIAALPASVRPAALSPTPAPNSPAAGGAGPSRSVPREPPGVVAAPAAPLQEAAAQRTAALQIAAPRAAAPQVAPATTVASAAGEVARAGADSASGRVARSPASATTGPVVASPDAAGALTGAQAALAEYLGAIEARDLDRLARAYPGMTEPQRRAWTTFFGSVANFRPRLVVDQLRPAGATARAHVRGAYEYENVRPRRAERLPVSFNVTLARDAGGWRVRAVE